MFDLNVPKLERLISERFTGKDESVVKTALSAFMPATVIRWANPGNVPIRGSQEEVRPPSGDDRQ
jgi:hypothetical protein